MAHIAAKLRRQDSLAGRITVFLRTNGFDDRAPQYSNAFTIDLIYPTAYTPAHLQQAMHALHVIYRGEYSFKKAGVLLSSITPQPIVQPDLFGELELDEHIRQMRLMSVVDMLNEIMGAGTITFASQGSHGWRMKQEWLSQRYTSRWDELLAI